MILTHTNNVSQNNTVLLHGDQMWSLTWAVEVIEMSDKNDNV